MGVAEEEKRESQMTVQDTRVKYRSKKQERKNRGSRLAVSIP